MPEINCRDSALGLGGLLYHRFSPYNFSRSDWLEAAKAGHCRVVCGAGGSSKHGQNIYSGRRFDQVSNRTVTRAEPAATISTPFRMSYLDGRDCK
jgi:hypothetical protein